MRYFTQRDQPRNSQARSSPPIWVADLSAPMFPVMVQIRVICEQRFGSRAEVLRATR